MPVLETAEQAVAQQPGSRRRFTVEQAAKVAELFPGERYELLEGDIVNKMGHRPPHAHLIRKLNGILAALFIDRVQIQLPVRLPYPDGEYSEPEPDVALLDKEVDAFADHHPGPEDIALLIEVSDTTFETDRWVKYRLYARAGVAEYWIIDIANRRTFVCREPAGDEYKSVTIVDAGEQATTSRAPGLVFLIDEVLPA